MKSGTRSTGETRYRTAAASAIFAALGRTGSTARPVMVRTMAGNARSSALTVTGAVSTVQTEGGLRKARPGSDTPVLTPSFQALCDQLADVLHGERLLGHLHFPTEIDHGETEGTARAHHVHLGLEHLLDADQVHPLLRFHLHPHVTAAAAAAESALAAARQLHGPEPGNGLRHISGRFGDAVVAPEVAGVVKRDRRVERLRRRDPSGGDQLLDDLRVMEHLVAPAELGELVLDRVEAVWAVGDDLPEAVPFDRFDVLLLDGLVQVLLAETAADLGVTPLLRHHAEAHAGRLEDLHHRAGDRLVTLVVRGRAADPVEVLDLAIGLHEGNVEALRPREALAGRQPPWVPGPLDVLERLGRRRGQGPLGERQIAPEVDDRVDDVDERRTLLHARHAGRARPQLVRLDQPAVDRARQLAVHVPLELHDDLLG